MPFDCWSPRRDVLCWRFRLLDIQSKLARFDRASLRNVGYLFGCFWVASENDKAAAKFALNLGDVKFNWFNCVLRRQKICLQHSSTGSIFNRNFLFRSIFSGVMLCVFRSSSSWSALQARSLWQLFLMCHVWSIFPQLELKLFEVVMQSVYVSFPKSAPAIFLQENHNIDFGIPACWEALIRIQAAEPIAYHCVRIQEIHRTNSSLHWLQVNVQLKASNLIKFKLLHFSAVVCFALLLSQGVVNAIASWHESVLFRAIQCKLAVRTAD